MRRFAGRIAFVACSVAGLLSAGQSRTEAKLHSVETSGLNLLDLIPIRIAGQSPTRVKLHASETFGADLFDAESGHDYTPFCISTHTEAAAQVDLSISKEGGQPLQSAGPFRLLEALRIVRLRTT